MADIVDAATRSRMMSAIRSTNTSLELRVRRYLHAQGFRYGLHSKQLPGRPDLWFPSRQAAIFVHGCFFHGHDCGLCRIPATRTEFWLRKIGSNRDRDQRVVAALSKDGIRAATIWECTFRERKAAHLVESRMAAVTEWLRCGTGNLVVTAKGVFHE